jgi:endonuclease YncB( thermonuclease family)
LRHTQGSTVCANRYFQAGAGLATAQDEVLKVSSVIPRVLRSAFAAAVVGVSLVAHAAGGAHEPWTEKGSFQSAPDGDTLKVLTAKHGLVIVRLAGVDCPEHSQRHWRTAKAHLVAMVGSSQVTIACYKTDRYNREVCKVRTAAGDLGAGLLEAGLAWHYKSYQSEQSPDERDLYARLELKARERRIGLWQEPDPMPPDVCRKGRRTGEKCR